MTSTLDFETKTVTWQGNVYDVSTAATDADPTRYALRNAAQQYETARLVAIRTADDLAAAATATAEGLRDRVQVSAPSGNRLGDLQAAVTQVASLEATLTTLAWLINEKEA